MSITTHLLVFTLDAQRYALSLSAAKRIVRAVAITPLPQAPKIVLGVVNVQGQLIPVVDLRQRFRLPTREIELNDRFIVAHTARRPVIVIADTVVGVQEFATHEVVLAEEIVPGMEQVEGMIKLADGMIFIHNLDRFLSLHEEQELHEALAAA